MPRMLTRGFIIALEGADCSGKSVQWLRLLEWFSGSVGNVFGWAEPDVSISPIGRLIRKMLTDKAPREPDAFEFQRMFVIDRAQTVFCALKQYREEQRAIVLDRYALSTIAYGMLSGRPAEDFIRLHHDVLGPSMIWPDISIVIDISLKTALKRLHGRNAQGVQSAPSYGDLFERAGSIVQVRRNYQELARRDDIGEVALVNGEQTQDAVFEDILALIRPRLPIAAEPSDQ